MAKRLTNKVWLAIAAFGCLSWAGCSEQGTIKVYQVPKEQASETPHQIPPGWTETAPNNVSVANFNIEGKGGGRANVSIAPLPLLADREAEVVNMWRQQMGMEEISREEAGKLLVEVDVAGKKGKLFELTGQPAGSEGSQSIITVMQHGNDRSWFYKISGDANLVKMEKTNFLAFIKSVDPEQIERTRSPHRHPPAPSMDRSRAESGFKWEVPDGWEELPPGNMQQARFRMPSQSGATAEVTVSIFPSDTGGNLANVNRWRGQLNLQPVDEAGLAKLVQPLADVPGAVLADMENSEERMIGAIVPRQGSWFFYKLRGGKTAVEAQKEAFVAFVRSKP